MKLGDAGVCYCFLSLPLGSFDTTRESWSLRLASLREKDHKRVARPRFTYLLGRADFLFSLDVQHFPVVSRLPASPTAQTSNWIYAIPYRDERERRLPTEPMGAGLRFVTHLRINRPLYQANGLILEQKIVAELGSMLKRYELDAEILVGLGWSDLIVDGHVTHSLEQLAGFLLSAHKFHAKAGRTEIPVFAQMLSTVGYEDVGTGPSLPIGLAKSPVKAVTFFRFAPGRFQEAKEAITRKLLQRIPGSRLTISDGKWDLALLPPENRPKRGKKAIALGEFLKRLRQLTDPPKNRTNAVDRTKTHLIFETTPQTARTARRRFIELPKIGSYRRTCKCVDDVESTGFHAITDEAVASRFLRTRIANVLELLNEGLRNQSICCDLQSAVLAARTGLERLILGIEDAGTGAGVAGADAVPKCILRDTYLDNLADWCDATERIFIERTIGSYEEILGQTDRVLTYRGGVQKMLFLVDGLIDDFARRIGLPNFLPLTAFYVVSGTISSLPLANIIKIPVRFLFDIPAALPTSITKSVSVSSSGSFPMEASASRRSSRKLWMRESRFTSRQK